MGAKSQKEKKTLDPGVKEAPEVKESAKKKETPAEKRADFVKEAAKPIDNEVDKKTDDTPKEYAEAIGENLDTPVAGKLHAYFYEELNKIKEESAEQDRTKLSGASIEDVRYTMRLLEEREEKESNKDTHKGLKTETARRIRAYTKAFDGEWYTLDYERMGSDSNGLTHELYIGLGDILVDPDVTDILVIKDGQKISAKRSVVQNGRYKGRLGFVDEYGEYVATHTNDKFRILSSDELETEKYLTKFREEAEVRKKHQETFVNKEIAYIKTEKDVTKKEDVKIDTLSGEPITQEIIDAAEKECSSGTSVEKVGKRTNFLKIVNYVAENVKIPASLIVAVLRHECSFQYWPPVVGDSGLAIGMAQHHPEGWGETKATPIFQQIMSQFVNEPPSEIGRGKHIVSDILSAAIRLKEGADKFGFNMDHTTTLDTKKDELGMTKYAWIRMYYHVPGHANVFADIKKKGFDNISPKYKARYNRRSKSWFDENKHRYLEYSNTVLTAKSALSGSIAA